MKLNGVSQEKLKARIAAEALRKVHAAGAVIEGAPHPAGSPIWKGALAAIALAGAVAAAGHADAKTMKHPAQEPAASTASFKPIEPHHAYEFTAATNETLESGKADWGRIKNVSFRPDGKQKDSYSVELHSDGLVPIPGLSTKTCTVSVASPGNLAFAYGQMLDIRPDVDLTATAQMHGTATCAAMALLERDQLDAYGKTRLGLAPIARVLSVIGNSKNGWAAYSAAFEFEAASALAMLKSDQPTAREGGALILDSLGKLAQIADPKYPSDAITMMGKANVAVHVDGANHLIRASQKGRLSAFDVTTDMSGLGRLNNSQIGDWLEAKGLPHAGRAARIGAATGLVLEGDMLASRQALGNIFANATMSGNGKVFGGPDLARDGSAFQNIPAKVTARYGNLDFVKEYLDERFGSEQPKEQVDLR